MVERAGPQTEACAGQESQAMVEATGATMTCKGVRGIDVAGATMTLKALRLHRKCSSVVFRLQEREPRKRVIKLA